MESLMLVIDALKWAFKILADNLVLYVKLIAVSTLMMIINALVSFVVIMMVMPEVGQSSYIIPFGFGAWLYLVPFYFTLCYINVALRFYDGQSVTNLKQFFVNWRLFAKSFVALCLYSILFALGMACFIIPGLIIAALFYYIIYCIMADDMGVIKSFKCSLQLTKKQPLHTLLLLVCSTLLGAIWFSLPVAALMNVYAYKQRKKSITYDA